MASSRPYASSSALDRSASSWWAAPRSAPSPSRSWPSNPAVDAVVSGEGEQTFAELLHSLVRGGEPRSVPGVTARDGDRIVRGPDRPAIENLDELHSPFSAGGHATDGSAYLETYRGCPHRCAYCFEGKG